MKRRQRAVAVVAALGAFGLAAWWAAQPTDEPAPVAVALPAPPPAQPLVAVPDAAVAVEETLELDAGPVNLNDPFCGPEFIDHITTRYTLKALLERESKDPFSGGPEGDLTELHQASTPQQRFEATRAAVERFPQSRFLAVALAMRARSLDRADEELAALRRARVLMPKEPAVGLALALATRDSGELDEAIEGLTTYLASDPNRDLERVLARLKVARDIQRPYRHQERRGLTVLWPPESLSDKEADLILSGVDRALDDAAQLTGTPRRKKLTVVVYPTRSELMAISCVPAWAGGLYDGTLRLVAERFDLKALRHETLHAQVGDTHAPLWFHEGLAQSFSEQALPLGLWRAMVKNHTWVPFTSLEGSFSDVKNPRDASLAYAQSYAMVELLRARGGDRAVGDALMAFALGRDTPTVLAEACGQQEVSGADLLAFIEKRLAAATGGPPR